MPRPTPSLVAYIDARWPDARRRAIPIALAIALEILLLLVLLSLGAGRGSQQPPGEVMSTFDVSAPRPAAPRDEPAPAAEAARPPTATEQPQPVRPSPLMPPPAAVLPRETTTPAPEPAPAAPTPSTAPAPSKITAVIRGDMSAAPGPKGSGAMPGDSKRIAGSGPNGEPLYAAQWYREPYRSELTGYLDDVNGSAWALINCRTVPDFKVDSCVLVDEWPDGGNMGRSILAAAWQFKVRPPRVGGRVMVGEWVRIRIDYEVVRK